jgi:hypothetical protein
MAYDTGSATTLQILFDAIITHLTSNGWVLEETIGAADKVVSSTGVGGDKALYYRITGGRGAVLADPARNENWAENIIVRGYQKWNVGAPGSGVNEFSHWGPQLFFSGTSANEPAIMNTGKHPNGLMSRTSYRSTTLAWGQHNYDGRRNWHDEISNNSHDMWNWVEDVQTGTAAIGIVQSGAQVVARDKRDDSYWLYHVRTSSPYWRRRNLETNVTEELTSTPGNVALAPMVFDGDDTIYTAQIGSTNFWKYTISTDTWTALAACPTTNDSYSEHQFKGPLYIPQAIGNWKDTSVSDTDVILINLNNTGTVLYRYNVNDDTWGPTHPALPVTTASGDLLTWDGAQYAWFYDITPGSLYRVDLNTGAAIVGGDWVKQFTSTIHPSGAPALDGMMVWTQYPGRVPTIDNATDPNEYFIHSTKDRCVVVVKWPSLFTGGQPHYYWMYFGAFDTLVKDSVMTAASGASAGKFVTVTVDDTSAYSDGEAVLALNQSTGAITGFRIQTIDTGTTFTAEELFAPISSGDIIGADPDPKCVAGCTGMMIAGSDVGGFESEDGAAGYILQPSVSTDVLGLGGYTGGNAREVFVPWPLLAWWRNRNGEVTAEARGLLKDVHYLANLAYPGPQNEEVLKLDGVAYRAFVEFARELDGPANTKDQDLMIVIPTD